jgi:N-carbamoylputrescine amidase
MTSPRPITLGLVQMTCSGDPAENTDKVLARLEEAADAGAQVLCTQELFRSPYPCQEEDHDFFALAEPLPGPTTERLAALAKKKGVVIVSSHFERRAAGVYHNTACVFDADGAMLGLYRKMHIPDDPHYYEKFYFTPGDLGYRAFRTRFGTIGVLVCWDQWYPEAARLTALCGAEIIFYPTAIGWLLHEKDQYGSAQHTAWETVQRGHAVANGAYVAAVNRVGVEGQIEFWGQSFVSDPQGGLVTRATNNSEEVVLAQVDLARVETVRQHWPFFRDRRIDSYGPITQRYIDGGATQ